MKLRLELTDATDAADGKDFVLQSAWDVDADDDRDVGAAVGSLLQALEHLTMCEFSAVAVVANALRDATAGKSCPRKQALAKAAVTYLVGD
jgi:hypothetical protein